MPPEANDAACLWDMLDAARAVTEFVSGRTKDEYGEIIQERIWSVIEDHIPELIAALEPLVPPAPESTEP